MCCEHDNWEPGDDYCTQCGCTDLQEIELTRLAVDNASLAERVRLMREFMQSRASGCRDGSSQWDVFIEMNPGFLDA